MQQDVYNLWHSYWNLWQWMSSRLERRLLWKRYYINPDFSRIMYFCCIDNSRLYSYAYSYNNMDSIVITIHEIKWSANFVMKGLLVHVKTKVSLKWWVYIIFYRRDACKYQESTIRNLMNFVQRKHNSSCFHYATMLNEHCNVFFYYKMPMFCGVMFFRFV